MNWERQAKYLYQQNLGLDAENETLRDDLQIKEKECVGLARIAVVGYALLALDLVVRILG